MLHKKLKIAISPCPNDTFIFGAWLKGHIISDSKLEFEVDYLDIQDLNEQALTNKYDIIKISAAFVPYVLDRYAILCSGGALTEKTGPLLIAKDKISLGELKTKKVLLPGKDTTAAFLFSFLFPDVKNLDYVLFSKIEDQILKGEADAGVIIHESRFNFTSKHLVRLLDLGEAWYQKTKTPIPLGIIAIKRSLTRALQLEIQEFIRNSIHWARAHTDELMPYIQTKSNELELEIINQHIDLYVNQYSIDLGENGKSAILKLCNYVDGKNRDPKEIFI